MLIAENITKRYRSPRGWTTALDKQSLSLPGGARIGLVGPSGCGKSTLGKVMAMLLQPDGGMLTVDDVSVRAWHISTPAALRRQVQIIWQQPRLAVDPRLYLREIILEPLTAHQALPASAKERRTLLAHWSERVGLTPDLLERHPHEVSDGQLQRVCLARALILAPRYLVCDELSSMLDVSTQAALLETIRAEQHARPLGVLLVTHDRTLANHWCDEIIALKAPSV